mmetsp:Transcript_57564/g.160292  ORF Transcript_57564/g.160292 Transcript_57564/m.160292 type:complete len:205 (-) Transcript_57564:17-631(-)
MVSAVGGLGRWFELTGGGDPPLGRPWLVASSQSVSRARFRVASRAGGSGGFQRPVLGFCARSGAMCRFKFFSGRFGDPHGGGDAAGQALGNAWGRGDHGVRGGRAPTPRKVEGGMASGALRGAELGVRCIPSGGAVRGRFARPWAEASPRCWPRRGRQPTASLRRFTSALRRPGHGLGMQMTCPLISGARENLARRLTMSQGDP